MLIMGCAQNVMGQQKSLSAREGFQEVRVLKPEESYRQVKES